jgi:heme oxygenase
MAATSNSNSQSVVADGSPDRMSPVSVIGELRSATWSLHQRLEKRLDVRSRFSDPVNYRAHLEKMWGFCAGIESRLGPHIFGDALPDFDKRRKLPLLRQDLTALGADAERVLLLPRCETLPRCADPSAAFGCLYVIEGATLGGRTLLPMVESRLGFTAERGATFLASYGEDVTSMWRFFGDSLDAWCEPQERRERAAVAAVATFASLEQWLCGNPHER